MNADRMQQAVLAIAAGNRPLARNILRNLIMENPRDERAWMLMAEAVEQREQVIDCLERILQINPDNQDAKITLAYFKGERIPDHESIPENVTPFMPDPSLDELVQENADFLAPLEPSSPPDTIQKRSDEESPTEIEVTPDREYIKRRSYPTTRIYEEHDLDKSLEKERPPRSRNWPLVIGSLLVLITLILAYFGPSLAPKDPLEISTILHVGEKYITPSYPPGTPGYPLGSDSNGRDLLSRMLWGLGPTLSMVLVVAAFRLILGTLIGLVAGWSVGLTGRILDTIIAAALSIPVIIIALGGIAAVGVDLGIWAFIFGLSITGWVETARIVREQTQAVRGQVYVEAARAMGASNISILLRHVLTQILSLLWMLFAFEISATLMLTAALGFLGYYIGGDVWVAVTDSTATAISGAPELGQLLATSGVSIIRPWGLLVVGALVFMIVLGFNLLGEGLRKQLSLFGKSGGTSWSRSMATFRFWFDEYIAWPLSSLPRSPVFRPALVVLLVSIVLVSGLLWGYNQFIASSSNPEANTSLQLEHLWSNAHRDPFGTRWVQAAGPESPEIVWTFSDESGFSGGPAVSRDGTVYVTSYSAILYALNPEGTVLWQSLLPEKPVDSPALSEDGQIYIADEIGGLSAVTPDGELQWQYIPESTRSTSAGPVVAGDGTIYYVLQGAIRALSPNGEMIWEAHPASPNTAPSELVQVSPNSNLLFWGDVILDAKDGSILETETLGRADQYFVGADRKIYQIEGHEVTQWEGDGLDASIGASMTWDHSKYTIARTPEDAGAAPDGVVWLFYTGFSRGWGFGEDTRIVWLRENGNLLGNAFHPIRNSRVIGIDEENIVYICGNLEQGYGDPQCGALSSDSEEALWTLILEESQQVAGGALLPGRLYITSVEGILYALGLPEPLPNVQQNVVLDDAALSPTQPNEPTEPSGSATDFPDRSNQLTGPQDGSNMLIFEDSSGFTGGPALGSEGTIYLLSKAGSMYAINPQGEINWEASLPANPVGTPVIGDEGQIYLSDKKGALSAFSPTGELIWRYLPEGEFKATSGPAIGPDGTIYYTVLSRIGMIQAVSRGGEGLWLAELETTLFYYTPQISPSGDFIFFRNELFDAATGAILDFNLDFEVAEFFAGEDGGNYLRAGGTVVEWTPSGTGIALAEERVLFSDEHMGEPNRVFVSSDGIVSLHYNTGILFFTKDGEALGTSFPEDTFLTHPVASDNDASAYICGRRPAHLFGDHNPICFALSAKSEQPLWEAQLSDHSEKIIGSALVPGAIYVTTEEGRLYIIGKAEVESTTKPEDDGALLFFVEPGGFSGSPAVDEDGTLYILSNSRVLYSLNSQGQINWQADLSSKPVGSPVIDPQAHVYLTQGDGSLSAYDSSGELIWQFTPDGEFKAVSGPAIGSDGILYYSLLGEAGMIQAVSSDGESQWLSEVQTSLFYRTPQVSQDGSFIFFRNEIFDAETGSPLDLGLDFEVDEFFVGQDGRNYLQTGGTVVSWAPSGTGIALTEDRVLTPEGRPDAAGVSQEGIVWLRYDNQFLWFTSLGEALGVNATNRRYFNHFIEVDEDSNLYTCGEHAQPTCYALSWNTNNPLWEVNLGTEYEKIAGITYGQKYLYVATEEGHLYIIGGVK